MQQVARRHPDTDGGERDTRIASESTFVIEDHWSWGDVAVGVLGVALALVAMTTLVRTGVGGWLTVLLAGWGLIVAVVALAPPPRRGRVERVVETH